jgi:hypothetical protein
MEVFDRAAALSRAGGDEERLEALMASFQKRAPKIVAKLEKAAQKRRALRVQREAEGLEAAAVEIGAEGLSDLAGKMVVAAASEDFEEIETLITHMGMELDWLLRVLDQNRCSGNL